MLQFAREILVSRPAAGASLRWRKDTIGGLRYSAHSMKHLPLSLETTVADALLATGRTSGVFRAHKTACVGCYLARFCTLRDVARTYDLSPDAFLAELERAADAESSLFIGAHNENSL